MAGQARIRRRKCRTWKCIECIVKCFGSKMNRMMKNDLLTSPKLGSRKEKEKQHCLKQKSVSVNVAKGSKEKRPERSFWQEFQFQVAEAFGLDAAGCHHGAPQILITSVGL